MNDGQHALVLDGLQARPHEQLVNDQCQGSRKSWTDTLRPFSFDAVEAPLWVRIWQQICLFVPALLFCLWCLFLYSHLYWQPIQGIVMCNVHLCWCILDQGRIWILGVVVLNKVMKSSANADSSYVSAAVSEDRAGGLHHAVFICAYKESLDVLRQTLFSISEQRGKCSYESYARCNIGVCLCMEAREGEDGENKANELVQEFQDKFETIEISYHPDKLAGEVQGKCSNLQWAVTHSRSRLDSNCLVTCGDADSVFDPFYFSAVSAWYIEHGAASNSTIFQPTMANFLNIFEQSHVVKASSFFATVGLLGNIEDPLFYFLPYSTFTVSSDFLRRFDGWDVDYLNDDWHTGTKSLVAEPLTAQLVHIPFPVVNSGVEAETCMGAFWARWKQAKRHALGVEELIYLLQMLPVCHWKVREEANFGENAGGGGGLIPMYKRFTRMLLYAMSVHIRLAFTLPCGFAMCIIWYGKWRHFQLYGEALFTSNPFRLNMWLAVVLGVIVLGESSLAVRMLRHLWAAGQIRHTGELPWWARSPVCQYIHTTVSMALSLPVVLVAASLAEIIAFFKVPCWNKQSFEFYVAPKVKGDVDPSNNYSCL